MTHSLPVAVHVFLKKEGQFLFLRRKGTGFQDGKWSVPAGRLEPNETITKAAIREAKEEVDVDITEQNIGLPLIMHHQDERGERIYAFFITDSWSGEPKNMEIDKCSEIDFFSLDNIPNSVIPHIEEALNSILSGKHYMEYGFKI